MDYQYQHSGELHKVTLETTRTGVRAVVAGKSYEVVILEEQPGRLVMRIGEQVYDFYWAAADGKRWISLQGCTYELNKPSPRAKAHGQEAGIENHLRAPMPAQVREVRVEAGQQVALGETLLILEAMKMEIRLSAPSAGRVVKVLAELGASVERDQVLVELEAE